MAKKRRRRRVDDAKAKPAAGSSPPPKTAAAAGASPEVKREIEGMDEDEEAGVVMPPMPSELGLGAVMAAQVRQTCALPFLFFDERLVWVGGN